MPTALAAQANRIPPSPRYSFQEVATELGLEAKIISALGQDADGFLWIGTLDGLYRFDGALIEVFRIQQGLPSEYIEQIVLGPDNRLWVSTAAGIAYFGEKRFHPLHLNREVDFSARKKMMPYRICFAGRDLLYIASQRGLIEFNWKKATVERWVTTEQGLPSHRIASIDCSTDGTLWLSTQHEVVHFSPDKGVLAIYSEKDGLPRENIIAALVSTTSTVWVRAMRQILRKEKDEQVFQQVEGAVAEYEEEWETPYLDAKGNFYLPTNRGLFIHDQERWQWISTKEGLVRNFTISVLQDLEGNLWVGTPGGGLSRWPGRGQWFGWSIEQGLPDATVWGSARDDTGRLWVGTNNGVAIWDVMQGQWTLLDQKHGLAGKKIRQVKRAGSGNMWLTSPHYGITVVNPETMATQTLPMPADCKEIFFTIDRDTSGTIWISCSGYLLQADEREDHIALTRMDVPESLKTSTRRVKFAPDGSMWTAGTGGLGRYVSGKWRHFTTEDGLQRDVVDKIAAVSRNEAWITYTEYAGLTQVTLAGERVKIRQYGVGSDLPTNSIFTVSRDISGNIWAGGNEGIFRLKKTAPLPNSVGLTD